MRTITLCLIGFGNVGRAFARLLLRKEKTLAQEFDLHILVTGILTGRHGRAIDSGGINLTRALEMAEDGLPLTTLSADPEAPDGPAFVYACPAQVLLENTPVNHNTGQPAIACLRAGLEKGMHAITANKGAVVFGYSQLRALAEERGRRFLFESAVMDGAPIFSLFRGPLPAIELRGFHGILNSCTNLLLEQMENGRSYAEAIAYAQSIGITETDPSADVDGWDAAIKVAALSTVLFGIPLTPQQVERQGIRELTAEQLREAHQAGKRWKLVCSAERRGGQLLHARVAPQCVGPESPLFSVQGTSSFVQFHSDVLPGLGILESNPGPETTAYGLLADLLNALRGA